MKKALFVSITIASLCIMGANVIPEAKAEGFAGHYPFDFWGQAYSDERHSVITGRFEQGAEVAEYKGWKLVPFVAACASSGSKRSEYWNNEFSPEFGIKIMRPFRIVKGGWGSANLGVRQKWHNYFLDSAPHESGPEVFIQIGFGGDWKND